MLRFYLFIATFIINLNSFANDFITIQSTTSTRDSGLYKYLLPYYPKYADINIKVIAVGTGQAIMNAKNCDGNILIVHDQKREDTFMRDNFGTHRHKLMYNDYIIIGPKNNKIKLENSESILEVFSKIYNNKLTFISRSDSSGTHAAEMAVWKKINLNPRIHSGSWYLESGQGMGPSLNIAISMNAIILSDRSSWLRFNNKVNHEILYTNHKELRNNYSMILVNHERCNNLNFSAAKELYDWLASDKAASLIKDYKIKGKRVFYID